MQRCPGFRWNLIGLAGIYEGVLCLLPESSGYLAQKSASRGLYHHFSTLASPQWPFRSRVQHVHFLFCSTAISRHQDAARQNPGLMP